MGEEHEIDLRAVDARGGQLRGEVAALEAHARRPFRLPRHHSVADAGVDDRRRPPAAHHERGDRELDPTVIGEQRTMGVTVGITEDVRRHDRSAVLDAVDGHVPQCAQRLHRGASSAQTLDPIYILAGPEARSRRNGGTSMDTINWEPHAEKFRLNPYPLYRQLREEAPLYHNEESAGSTPSAASTTAGTRWSTPSGSSAPAVSPSSGTRSARSSMILMDPPRHTWHRKVMSRMFTPRVIANLEPMIRDVRAAARRAPRLGDVRRGRELFVAGAPLRDRRAHRSPRGLPPHRQAAQPPRRPARQRQRRARRGDRGVARAQRISPRGHQGPPQAPRRRRHQQHHHHAHGRRRRRRALPRRRTDRRVLLRVHLRGQRHHHPLDRQRHRRARVVSGTTPRAGRRPVAHAPSGGGDAAVGHAVALPRAHGVRRHRAPRRRHHRRSPGGAPARVGQPRRAHVRRTPSTSTSTARSSVTSRSGSDPTCASGRRSPASSSGSRSRSS